MTVSDYLLARLKQAGVDHLFAVPGDYASPFMEALDSSPDIKRVGAVNELGSGYAADGYARFKGAGAACVQYGVGTFSLLNCAAGSFVERVPVAVISASPNQQDRVLEQQRGVLFHHSTGDLRADQLVFRNVTVASEIIGSAETAPAQIDWAITQMLTHRRPIYIEVLNNVWTETCADPAGSLVPRKPSSDPESLAAALDAAWALIQSSALPVIWGGVEIQRFGLQDTLQAIVDSSGLPFTTTSLGKTVLDEAQAQFIGTYAGPASPALTRAVMETTDCPIALGAIITDDYLDIVARIFGRMIVVTSEQARVGFQYFQNIALRDFVNGLLERFKDNPGCAGALSLPGVAPDRGPEGAGPDALTYTTFYDAFSSFYTQPDIRDTSILILGESTSLYVFGNLGGLPKDSFVAQAAWGSLGHETGCALGVALATGKRPWVIAGDGGFRMVCQELSSMAAQGVNAVVFVMSNDVYAIEQAFVNIDAFKPNGQFAAFDVLPTWNYAALAQAFGAQGYRAAKVSELQAILTELKGLTGKPALVEVVIPQKDLAPQLARLAAPLPSA